MKILFLVLFATVVFAVGVDYVKSLKAYLTSKGFEVYGELFQYDFDKDGKIDYNDWILLSLKDKKLYRIEGRRPQSSNPLGLTPVNGIKLDITQPSGYLIKSLFPLDAPGNSYLYLSLKSAKVYKILSADRNGFLKYLLLNSMTFNIDDGKAYIVYREPKDFKNVLFHFDTPGFTWSVEADDTYIYLADGVNGLVVLGNDIKNLKKVAHIPTSGHSYRVRKSGKELFLANGKEGVVRIRGLKPVEKLKTDGDIEDISVKDALLLASSPKKGFYLYRYGPKGMVLLKVFTSKCASGGKIDGNKVYMLDGCVGLLEYDPVEKRVKTVIKDDSIKSFDTLGKRYIVYTKWNEKAFYLFDKTSRKRKRINTIFNINRLIYLSSQKKLFVLNSAASVSIWNIAGFEIKFVKNIYLPYPAYDIKSAREPDTAFVANGGNGLLVIRLK